MTPYESALYKKRFRATQLSNQLTRRASTSSASNFPERHQLEIQLQQIQDVDQQLDNQLRLYQDLANQRWWAADGTGESIRKLTIAIWADVDWQFGFGTVPNNLIKIVNLKLRNTKLPPFPVDKRKPINNKDLLFFEDSYELMGQYFHWLLVLLQMVSFQSIQCPYSVTELQERSQHYDLLHQQVRQASEKLWTLQVAQNQQYMELKQMISAAIHLLKNRNSNPDSI